MKELGVGIIGVGNISETYLAFGPKFRGFAIRSIADIKPETANKRAAEYKIRSKSVDAMLASDDIDIIVNLTIPEAHFSVTKNILEAGKHAYSEKPFVPSVEEGNALKEIADHKGLRIGSAPDTFLGSSHQLARKLIDDGAVGKIVSGTAHMMSHGMEHWHPHPDFFFLPGAGPMLDVGPYYITNLIQLIGPVKRVVALTSSASDTRTILSEPRAGEKIPVKTPTNIHALLEFEQGASVAVTTSWDVWSHRHAPMELYGAEGTLYAADPDYFGGDIEMCGRDGEIKTVEAWDHPYAVPNEVNARGMHVAQYRGAGLADLAIAIAEDRPHRCSFDLSLHAVDVMTAVLRSGEERAFIDLSTSCERPALMGPTEALSLMR